MLSKVTEFLDSYIKDGMPFYDCAVMKDGVCVYRHSNGYTDTENKTAVTGKEKYNIYSCSKLITCTAALQLWERGCFALDDKLSDYMPEFEKMTVKCGDEIIPAKNPILIKHLFTMTAGFSYKLDSPEILLCKEETGGRCETRELMRYLAKEPLLFEPGERWEYSLCHDVLAAFVEVVSGVTFGEYVRENIFAPLGMKDSTFLIDDSRLDEIVDQYRYKEGEGIVKCDKTICYKLGREYESGGAGCISTVDDYMKLIEALRVGNVILKRETIDLLATVQTDGANMDAYWVSGYGYGLGQRCPKDDTVSDFGWGGAAGAYYAIDRECGITVYFATHVLGYSRFGENRTKLLRLVKDAVMTE